MNKAIASLLFLLASFAQAANAFDGKMQNFPLSDVHLLDSRFSRAADLNIKVLLEYDVDRLLAPFLSEAGLQPKGELFTNWSDLNGHVAGHYLSALALAYASTGNEDCLNRLKYMISELKACQDKNGNGYLAGMPGGKKHWARVKAGEGKAVADMWVPWYNMHKTYAGLRDAWFYAGDETARKMFLDMCDWGADIISNLDDEQMEIMLNTEFGGMNEVFVDAYEMTGDQKYLDTAKRFSHRRLFDSMARRVDNLDNMHANTQVPKAVGYQRVAEATGDSAFTTAAEFFWETVTQNRSLSFGGNSRREHFPSASNCRNYTEEREGPESCNTYNMLKLSEGLFRMNPDVKYADFYERALYNHILSTQHPQHGGYVYFTSARPRHYRVYSAVNEAMWCCVGTGMENHEKYGEFIYTHTADALYVNLFIPSKLDWKEQGLTLTQTTSFPESEKSTLTLDLKKSKKFEIKIRCPKWLDGAMSVKINGKEADCNVVDSYATLDRKWKNGDKIEVTLPMKTYIERMPNVPDFISILHGPVVLAVKTGTEDLKGLIADDGRWGHIASGTLLPLYDAPIIVADSAQLAQKIQDIKPIPGKPLHYSCKGLFAQDKYDSLELEPFADIHDSRYAIYFQVMSEADYKAKEAELKAAEEKRLALDRRTVDMVNCGEQQPEFDHSMKAEKTSSGYYRDESYRKVSKGGSLSYTLSTGGKTDQSLLVQFWGAEKGDCRFEILIDGIVLANDNLTGKWNEKSFMDAVYSIPADLLSGKDSVTITLRPLEGNAIPGIYSIRLINNN